MLSNINWQGYWISLAITTVLFYTVVYLVFFRKQLPPWLQHGFTASNPGTPLATSENNQPVLTDAPLAQTPEAAAPEFLPAVHALTGEIHLFFESIQPASLTKPALVSHLKTITQKHPGVKGTPYQYALNSLIVFLAEQDCSLHLDSEEVEGMWV